MAKKHAKSKRKRKPKPKVNCNNRSRVCVYHCALLEYTVQHRTVCTIFHLVLQTIITA